MDWVVANFGEIMDILIAALVGGAWLWLRYRGQQDRLEADLKMLLNEALDFLRAWAGERLNEVTREDVWKVAEEFYTRYIVGTLLVDIVSLERFRELLWAAFERVRSREVAAVMRRL
jgi:hypothetical protein